MAMLIVCMIFGWALGWKLGALLNWVTAKWRTRNDKPGPDIWASASDAASEG